jgi:bifunctional enzyme CysN/CysC
MGPLRVVIAGHVDHGKSTLVGRLMHDTGSLTEGRMQELEESCESRGLDVLEWSFLLDSFQAERDQAVTIDTTQIRLSTGKRDVVIIDAPGHIEFLKNMITGAAAADAAILVIDAVDGLQDQTRRHAFMLHLLGLKQVAVVVNKMDMVGYQEDRFCQIEKDILSCLKTISLDCVAVIPVAARHGDMLVDRGKSMPWYGGPTLLAVFDSMESTIPPVDAPLRFSVQDVYRFDEQRIVVGRVEIGIIRQGDTLLFSPHQQKAIVSSLAIWPADINKTVAQAGESIGLILDRPVFVERGYIASHEKNPPSLTRAFRATIFWFSTEPLKQGAVYKLHYGTHQSVVTVQSVDRVIDAGNLQQNETTEIVPRHAVADIVLSSRDMIAFDPSGRFALYNDSGIVGGGLIREAAETRSSNISSVAHSVTADDRARQNGHQGGVFWLTGLSASGKSTLAMAAERILHERGYRVYVLDGDNLRHGLNADLGFAPEDRAENIRRVGEVAALMADSGLICLSAFISPYRADRDRARAAAKENFHEIFVSADLSVCEARDPKGLYQKARRGEITDFTGIDAPYESPTHPELQIDTGGQDIPVCVQQIVDYIEQHSALRDIESLQKKDKVFK